MENLEVELTEDAIVGNFVPLTWVKSPKPHTTSSPDKDNNNSDAIDSKEEAAIAITSLMASQPSGFTCVQCGHVVHRSQLLRHVRMHTADRPFKCEVCKRAFRQKSNLIVHMRMHTGELPFKCHLCDKAFRQKSILVTHVRTHTREMPYKCHMCPKAFTQKSNLVEHVRVHTGEKPYTCPECNKAFAQKSNLVVHIRSHTGEAPFKCVTCGKAFRQKSILTTHMRTHTGELPFKCQECDRAFAQKSNLVEHSRQHTGEKPYVCQECDKAFIRHQDLLQHSRHHTGRKPYDCQECGKMFVRKKHMEKHYQSHIKHRFNCKVCGLGFMDENLMVIHLTTHCHCHICDLRFNTKEELTEHCRIHALGMSNNGAMGAMPSNAPQSHNLPLDQIPSNDRINDAADSAKQPKTMQIDPATFSVVQSQSNDNEAPMEEYRIPSSNDQISASVTITEAAGSTKPYRTIRIDPATYPPSQSDERETVVAEYIIHTSRWK